MRQAEMPGGRIPLRHSIQLKFALTYIIIIAAVLKNGPADKAGVKPGDILVSVEGQTISNMSEMFNLIAKLKPDSKTKIVVLREGKEFPLEIIVGKRPSKKKLENQSQ